MRRTFVLVAVLLAACSQPTHSTAPASAARSAAGDASASPSSPAAVVGAMASAGVSQQDQVAGPAGMTLAQEIGAVMMVGFRGPLTDDVLKDWRQRQFGGLVLLPANQNSRTPAGIADTIQRIRGVVAHALLTATDQEGGAVCFRETGVPCLGGGGQADMATMSQGLKALGFDINLGPNMHSGNPAPVVAGIHAAGMYATARNASDAAAWREAAGAGADFMMVGSSAIPGLRAEVGYTGLLISEDLSAAASAREVAAAGVRFLQGGGDMVMVARDLSVADATYDAIHAAIVSGAYQRSQLDGSVTRLLSLRLRYMP